MFMIFFIFVAFCPLEMTNSTRGTYSWPETRAEVKPSFPCQYGAVVGIHGEAIRRCDERGHWEDSNLQECLTLAEMQFRKAKNVSLEIVYHLPTQMLEDLTFFH